MFKSGDKVICIDDSDDSTTFEPNENLKKYSTYIIKNKIYYFNCDSVSLTSIDGKFRTNRFILQNEYRKMKLEKLKLIKIKTKKKVK